MFCVKVAATETKPEIKHKDVTGKLVCSALTLHYHHCVVCFVLTTVTLTHPWVEIAPYFGRAETSNVIEEPGSKRSYRKCWTFSRVKVIVSRWSFLSLQGKKRSKIRVLDNTYCCQIQVAFLDSLASFGSQNTREPARRLKGITKKCILKGRKISTYLHLFCIKFPTFSYNCFAYYCDTDFLSFC